MISAYSNAFKMVDTYGLPLDMVIKRVSDRGLACDLQKFIQDALNAGWTQEKAVSVCNEAVSLLRGQHCNFYWVKP